MNSDVVLTLTALLTGERICAASPSWVIVTVCPAIVIVPVRETCAVELEATEYVTVPLPLPFDPAVMVSHDGALLVAVQSQPAGAVTVAAFPLEAV